MKGPHRSEAEERPARIERLIERYRLIKRRRLMRLAMKMWRQVAAEQHLARLEERPDRVH